MPPKTSRTYTHPDLNEVPLAAAMQALADPSRVAIVRTLMADGGRELACNEFDLCQSKATISHHFDILREAGIIHTRTEGRRCLSKVRQGELEKRFPGLLKLVLAEEAATPAKA